MFGFELRPPPGTQLLCAVGCEPDVGSRWRVRARQTARGFWASAVAMVLATGRRSCWSWIKVPGVDIHLYPSTGSRASPPSTARLLITNRHGSLLSGYRRAHARDHESGDGANLLIVAALAGCATAFAIGVMLTSLARRPALVPRCIARYPAWFGSRSAVIARAMTVVAPAPCRLGAGRGNPSGLMLAARYRRHQCRRHPYRARWLLPGSS